MAEVEIYEVFCFCTFLLDVFVMELFLAYLGSLLGTGRPYRA